MHPPLEIPVLLPYISLVCVSLSVVKRMSVLFEPSHDKTNKMACAPSQDSDQPGHPHSLHCPHEESLGPYSAGEEKSPYFLFHGETALHKALKFQGETPNFSEKFQGEIAEFLRENMEFYR